MESFDFIANYQSSGFRLAFSILHDEADAEDALQEAMIRAYINYSSFRGISFRSWFLTIVRNRCYDFLRRKKNRLVTSLDGNYYTCDNQDAYEMSTWQTAKDLPLEQRLEQEETLDNVYHCLARLPGDYRKAIFLVDIQGMGYSEAAEKLGKPVGTVKSRLARGRAKIQNMVENFATSLPLSA
jgi:RNA polymerase sigma-70 factor, ECF subfamily